jgi:hypothetical protein
MKITTYVTVTDPISMGFPVFEAVKSYLSFSDEVLLIVGRDTENFCKQVSEVSDKVVCLETNLWPKDWNYNHMTYHMNFGLQKAEGDIIVHMGADCIFADQHGGQIRDKLIDILHNKNFCHFDRLNYYHGYGYGLKSGITLFAINKKRMLDNSTKFEISAPNGSNVLLIDGAEPALESETRIKEVNLLPRNFDDTFCSLDQGLKKWFAWGVAHEKTKGIQVGTKSWYSDLDISESKSYEEVKNDWLSYKARKASSCTSQYEHPDIVKEKLLIADKKFHNGI